MTVLSAQYKRQASQLIGLVQLRSCTRAPSSSVHQTRWLREVSSADGEERTEMSPQKPHAARYTSNRVDEGKREKV